ncbi:MAG: S-layer homology domain-containing protein [Candidatus Margulisbacteria bacterium]|nr:S-layer homology domain-containing protein [Candidatus Margulisiibacteriota bacterium]
MLKKTAYFLLLILVPFCGLAWPLVPGSQNQTVGARPLGLGRAFAGLADDGSAVFMNPAGLARIDSLKLLNFYTSPDPNNSIIAISAALPKIYGLTAGIGYTNNINSGFTLPLPNTVEASFMEQQYLFCLAGKLGDRLSLGLNLDIITKSFSVQSSLLAGQTGSGMDLDLAFFYAVREGLDLGLNLQNILPTNLGGKFVYDSRAVESIPANLKAGVAWKFRKGLNLLFDIDRPLEQSTPTLLHLGLEYRPNSTISLRGGVDQNANAQATVLNNLTFGLGINVRGVTFDYSYYKYGGSSGRATNYFSLGYVGPAAEVTPRLTREAAVVLPSELLPPPVAIRHFSDVPADYPRREAIELMTTAGIIYGFPDGTFRPEQKVTRQEFETVLALARRVEAKNVNLPDKPITRVQILTILSHNGIGLPSFKKLPANEPVSRAELADMMYQTPFGQAAAKRLR